MATTERMDLDRLLTLACDQALLAEDEGARDPQGHAVEWAMGLLTPADRLSLIADLAKDLPHGAAFELTLGASNEAVDYLLSAGGAASVSVHDNGDAYDVAEVCHEDLSIRAQRHPKRRATPEEIAASKAEVSR